MKKIILLPLITIMVSSCTFPSFQTETREPSATGNNTREILQNEPVNKAQETTTETKDEKDPTETLTLPDDTPAAISEGSTYLPYTTTALKQAKGDVILFFSALWSPACNTITKDIEANKDTIPSDLTILQVNYDDAEELKKFYEVTTELTLVQVDNTGKMIRKWRGGQSLADIIKEYKSKN